MSSNWRNRPRPTEKSVEQVVRITGYPGKSTEDETAAAKLIVATKRGNARGAKGLAASNVFINGREGCDDKATHHAAGPATKTVRQGEGRPIVAILGTVWPRLQTRHAPDGLSAGQAKRRRSRYGWSDVRGHRSRRCGVLSRPASRGAGAALL